MKKHKRGFVLIIILVIAVAVMAAAVGISAVAGRGTIASTYSTGAEEARMIAQSGLVRFEQYAMEDSKANGGDFDTLLDPGLASDCSNVRSAGTVVPGPNTFTPNFTDDTIISYNGKKWSMVPFAGGAYLLRVDDNNDDNNTRPGSFTSNHKAAVGSTPFCVEGPSATQGTAGFDNPVRDRDRAVWLTSIGIYPGIDPLTAKHRVVMRKMVINSAVVATTASAFQTGGSIHGNIQLCTNIASVAAVGDFDDLGTGTGCGCDTNTTPTGQFQNFDSCGACCAGSSQNQVQAPVTPPVIDSYDSANRYDWTSPCNFYLDPAQGALFYWDAQGTRASNCNTYIGNMPLPSTDPAAAFPAGAGSCWTPIARKVGAVETIPLGLAEVTTAGANFDWNPSGAALVNIPSTNAGGYYTSLAPQVIKPAWAVTCPLTGAPSDFDWTPPSVAGGGGTENPTCGANCNGATTVLKYIDAAGAGQKFQFQANKLAYPVGVYVHQGNFIHVPVWPAGGPPPQTPIAGWAMFSLVVNGTLTVNGKLDIGAGTIQESFSSVMATGAISVPGTLNCAGSVETLAGVTVAGNAKWYGVIHTLATVTTTGAGQLAWDYKTDLLNIAASGAQTVPVPMTSAPSPL